MLSRRFRAFVVYIVVGTLSFSASSQSYVYEAEKFTKDHGLPDDYIKDLELDNNGNLWIITRKGLVYFDEYSFESIPVESVLPFKELEIDVNGNLWLSLSINEKNKLITERIVIYNPITKKSIKLENYCLIGEFDNSKSVYMWQDKAKNIFLSYDRRSVFMYDGSELKLVAKKRSDFIVDIKNQDSHLLSFVNEKKDTVITQDIHSNSIEVFRDEKVNFYIWHNGQIMFTSHRNRLSKEMWKERITSTVNLVSTTNDTLIKTSKNNLHFEISENDFYYIYNEELNVYNLDNKNIINLNKKLAPIFNKLDLLNIRIYNNIIWIGTNKGLIKIEKNKNVFQAILNDDNISTREMLVISKDSLLLCTEHGLYLLDINTNQVLQSVDDEIQFYGITQIENKKYILNTFGHMIKVLDLDSFTTEWYPTIDDSYSIKKKTTNVYINSFKDDTGQLWLTSTNGICIYEIDKNKIEHLFLDKTKGTAFTDIVAGHDENHIFLLSDNGIYQVDIVALQIEEFEAFENKIISSIVQDIDDETIYWVGTRYEGLLKWKYKGEILEWLDEDDGLSNNNVHSIFQDSYNRLWLSTDYGISVFDKMTGEISTIDIENGIHEIEMNRHSYCFVNDSLIIYGSINGIIKFNPYDVRLEDNNEKIVIKSLYFVNESNDKIELIPIDKNVSEIILKEYQTKPKLIFDIPQNSYANTLRYIFSSDDNKWSYTQKNFIDLSNIGEGQTNLFVSKKVGVNQWSSPKTIKLYSAPPFYRNYWFYAMIISVLTIGVFLYIHKRRLKIIKLNRTIQNEVDKKTVELFNKNKLLAESKLLNDQLFSMIGHDLRSPLISLNNISSSLKYLTDAGKIGDVQELSKYIEKNSKKSLAIIDRLVDWTEQQKASMMEIHEFNIFNCIQTAIIEQEELAKNREVDFTLDGEKLIKVTSNEASLLIVLGNIISNAIKFSLNGERVNIKFFCRKSKVIIEVLDRGMGISEAQLAKLNKHLPVISEEGYFGEKGLGMGLALSSIIIKKINGNIKFESSIGEGTKVLICLPGLL